MSDKDRFLNLASKNFESCFVNALAKTTLTISSILLWWFGRDKFSRAFFLSKTEC